jgi:hypothetical protein
LEGFIQLTLCDLPFFGDAKLGFLLRRRNSVQNGLF